MGNTSAAMILGNTPFLSTHLNGDTAWVDVLFVPRDQHRQGHGRTIFERWATKLPATIRKIQLLAVDLDDESPLGFWQKMGFEVEDAEFPDQFTGSYMVKRVSDSVPMR
jgi:GNAT superfamily N-acetyltransferase